jgi:hypothetical protein
MKRKHKLFTGFAGVLSGLIAALGYVFLIRPWHLRWGARDEELDFEFPGDDLVPNPQLSATHAISIQAPPESVWPWLVQIGQGRAGFYSYDWIENSMGLDIHSASGLLPEHQTLEVGDLIPLSPDGMGIPVAHLDPHKALILHGDTRAPGEGQPPVLRPGDFLSVSWGFYLFDDGQGGTRLIERFRADWNQDPLNFLFYRVFLEPGSFIMERKMLLGIKARAEAQPTES